MAFKVTRQTVLSGLIHRHKFKRGAELGVWKGATLGHLLRTHPGLFMIGVDHWKPVGAYAGKDMATARKEALEIAEKYPERCDIIERDTGSTAAFVVPDAWLDFVFIDAAHDEASVRADIEAWRPKVRSGGLLTGHDSNLPGVQAALNAKLPGWRELRANVWIWEVP